jgi:hypothetical protein
MRMSVTVGAALAFALLASCGDAADALKSGPQVGEGVGVFEPLCLNTQRAGQKFCPV